MKKGVNWIENQDEIKNHDKGSKINDKIDTKCLKSVK